MRTTKLRSRYAAGTRVRILQGAYDGPVMVSTGQRVTEWTAR